MYRAVRTVSAATVAFAASVMLLAALPYPSAAALDDPVDVGEGGVQISRDNLVGYDWSYNPWCPEANCGADTDAALSGRRFWENMPLLPLNGDGMFRWGAHAIVVASPDMPDAGTAGSGRDYAAAVINVDDGTVLDWVVETGQMPWERTDVGFCSTAGDSGDANFNRPAAGWSGAGPRVVSATDAAATQSDCVRLPGVSRHPIGVAWAHPPVYQAADGTYRHAETGREASFGPCGEAGTDTRPSVSFEPPGSPARTYWRGVIQQAGELNDRDSQRTVWYVPAADPNNCDRPVLPDPEADQYIYAARAASDAPLNGKEMLIVPRNTNAGGAWCSRRDWDLSGPDLSAVIRRLLDTDTSGTRPADRQAAHAVGLIDEPDFTDPTLMVGFAAAAAAAELDPASYRQVRERAVHLIGSSAAGTPASGEDAQQMGGSGEVLAPDGTPGVTFWGCRPPPGGHYVLRARSHWPVYENADGDWRDALSTRRALFGPCGEPASTYSEDRSGPIDGDNIGRYDPDSPGPVRTDKEVWTVDPPGVASREIIFAPAARHPDGTCVVGIDDPLTDPSDAVDGGPLAGTVAGPGRPPQTYDDRDEGALAGPRSTTERRYTVRWEEDPSERDPYPSFEDFTVEVQTPEAAAIGGALRPSEVALSHHGYLSVSCNEKCRGPDDEDDHNWWWKRVEAEARVSTPSGYDYADRSGAGDWSADSFGVQQVAGAHETQGLLHTTRDDVLNSADAPVDATLRLHFYSATPHPPRGDIEVEAGGTATVGRVMYFTAVKQVMMKDRLPNGQWGQERLHSEERRRFSSLNEDAYRAVFGEEPENSVEVPVRSARRSFPVLSGNIN